jgi:hypothetical protein
VKEEEVNSLTFGYSFHFVHYPYSTTSKVSEQEQQEARDDHQRTSLNDFVTDSCSCTNTHPFVALLFAATPKL